MTSPQDEAIASFLSARLVSLRSMPSSALRVLPEYSDTPLTVSGHTLAVATWRQSLPNGRTLIVVQCKRNVALGFGFMQAQGFVLTANGEIEDPSPELMSEYS